MTQSILKYLALGDSYTIGTSVSEPESFPVQLTHKLNADQLRVELTNIIAVNGWTTADLLKAISERPTLDPSDLVTLLIGVNNQYQGRSLEEYRREFTTLIEHAIRLAGNRPQRVFVLSIPDYSVTPFASDRNPARIAADIDLFNEVNRAITNAAKACYLDITPESRKAAKDPSLIASDGLHFSGREYAVWATMLAPAILEAIAK